MDRLLLVPVSFPAPSAHYHAAQKSVNPLSSSAAALLQVYKYKDSFIGGQVKVEVYISFGGLLMLLVGDPKKLQDLEVDSSVYLLMRKV